MAWIYNSFCPAVLSGIKVIVFRHTHKRLRSRRGLLPIIVQMLKHGFLPPRYCQTACYLQAVHSASNGLASVIPAWLSLHKCSFVASPGWPQPLGGRRVLAVQSFFRFPQPPGQFFVSRSVWLRLISGQMVSKASGRFHKVLFIGAATKFISNVCQSLPSRCKIIVCQ